MCLWQDPKKPCLRSLAENAPNLDRRDLRWCQSSLTERPDSVWIKGRPHFVGERPQFQYDWERRYETERRDLGSKFVIMRAHSFGDERGKVWILSTSHYPCLERSNKYRKDDSDHRFWDCHLYLSARMFAKLSSTSENASRCRHSVSVKQVHPYI